jgi:hypothetical protein
VVLDYLDRDDQSTWEIDQLTGYDVYTGRVVERHLNLYGQVVREVRYRTRFMVPSRPVIGAGMGGGPSRGRGVRTLVGRAPRRSAIRTFPPGCGRGAKPLRFSNSCWSPSSLWKKKQRSCSGRAPGGVFYLPYDPKSGPEFREGESE